MTAITVTISIEDSHLNRIEEVIQNLQSVGLDVEHSMPTIGAIVGSIESDRVQCLAEIEGVHSVELEREYQLPPSDADIQ